MFASIAIISKEGVDIALIIALLLISTKGILDAKKWLFYGCIMGIVTAVVLAIVALTNAWLATAFKAKLTQAAFLILLSYLIATTTIFIQSKPFTKDNSEANIKTWKCALPLFILLLIAVFIVVRDGFNVAFFLLNLVHQSDITHSSIIIGSLIGVLQTIVVGAVAYAGLILIEVNITLSVFPTLMALLSAGMAGQAVIKLSSIGLLPPIIPQLWNTTPYFDHHSNWLALIMRVMVGYTEKPSLMQLIVYIATFMAIFIISKNAKRKRVRAIPLPPSVID
ncbi:FTR1 family protein [Vibrio ezurae]|uniref:Iron permease n=1 Tax=Vibrio ezurae NBRC 102218 TaxID=1219080 RepID=U3AZV1_9VIBR|nr:FTR1 family protein [Vibrio ezurae]GAD79255.1 hypothetical protein VEZ01S_09_00230 [Vibrio ezurae NBRC 102218]